MSGSRPRRIPGRSRMTRAAVAAILRDGTQGAELLLVQRARRVGDPWSGDMAFPGGRQQAEDRNTLETAMRETSEETGLALEPAACLGRLSDVVTRKHEHWRPMVVTPWLFRIEERPDWQLNHELTSQVWVPLSFLMDTRNRERMRWKLGPVKVNAPCYHYQDYRIWGLTLMMIDGLLRLLDPSASRSSQRSR